MNLDWVKKLEVKQEYARKMKQAQKEETEAEQQYLNADEFTDEAVFDEPDESEVD